MVGPTAADVAAYLGKPGDAATEAATAEHLPIVTAMVKSYTRDRGFDPTTGEPGEDVAAVIVTATARSATNPTGLRTETTGPFTTGYGTFNGWTLAELAVLHRYRQRAR